MKKFFESFLKGAGTALGAYVVKETIKAIQDPNKRDAFKRKFTNVKKELFKTNEE